MLKCSGGVCEEECNHQPFGLTEYFTCPVIQCALDAFNQKYAMMNNSIVAGSTCSISAY